MATKVALTKSLQPAFMWADLPRLVITVQQDEQNAKFQFVAAVQSGGASTFIYSRIIRVSDSHVVAQNETQSMGSINLAGTANVVAGEQYKVQAFRQGPAPSVMIVGGTSTFTGQPATYFSIT